MGETRGGTGLLNSFKTTIHDVALHVPVPVPVPFSGVPQN